jgi:hypothetical protein
LREQSRSLPFPFFVPPPSERDNNRRHPRSERFRDDEKKHNDELEDFLRGWQEVFDGEDMEKHRENNRRKREEQQQQSIEELHREMQSMFEAAFAGGMTPPHGKGQNGPQSRGGGWSSSSSTTFVSNYDGTSYTMKQDSKNGARVDLKLPKNCESENVSLEVLKDRPCLIRWKNHNDDKATSNGQHPSSRHRKKPNTNPSGGQVFELGDSVDCSRLSASISEAQRTLTVEAPPRGRNGASIEGNQQQQHLSLKPNSYPRPVRVTKKQ